MPIFQAQFAIQDGSFEAIEMLADSGADVSFVPFNVGLHVGFKKTFGETPLLACGVGSKVPYLLREASTKIEGTELTIRLLWGQDEAVTDILLGRLDVFDLFDVTFSQSRQQIRFDLVEPPS